MQVQGNIFNRLKRKIKTTCNSYVKKLLYCYDMVYLLTAIGLTPGGSSTYTFTHKQYTEQHNETEYPERNEHNN
jgi:hypothetical protein